MLRRSLHWLLADSGKETCSGRSPAQTSNAFRPNASPHLESASNESNPPRSNATTLKQHTIVRIWRGRVPSERADEYEAYNYEAGIKPLLNKALGVQTLREDRENETEFMTISYWESVENSPAAIPGRFIISTGTRNS